MRQKSAETTKKVVWFCLANGVAWVWCSYLLAYLGRAEIAESLSKVALTEIVAVVDVDHAGTIDDPIPAARGMDYIYGKYYSDPEDGKIYLCKRTGEEPGGAKTDHCGIVESVDGTYISAIEGNTSSASDASNAGASIGCRLMKLP